MSVTELDIDEKVFEVYTEIQVTVYVDNAVLLRENYSSDAKIVNVKDRIGSIDECLQGNGMCTEERYDGKKNRIIHLRENGTLSNKPCKTNKSSTRYTQKHSKMTHTTRPTDDYQNCNSKDDKRTLENEFNKASISGIHRFCVKRVEHKMSNNQYVSPVLIEKPNKCSSVHKSSHTSTYFMEDCTSKLSTQQNEIISKDLENETSDYDESSSGVFSDDETEIDDDILIRGKHLEVKEQLKSVQNKLKSRQITNNSKQNKSDSNRKGNTLGECHPSGFDRPSSTSSDLNQDRTEKTENHNNKRRDGSGIETLRHKTTKICTNDFTNRTFDKIESESRGLQTPNLTISCVHELESMEPCGNITADTNCRLNDKECHEHSTKFVTKCPVINQLTRETDSINSNGIPLQLSTKCKENNPFQLTLHGQQSLTEPKSTTEKFSSICLGDKVYNKNKKNVRSTSSDCSLKIKFNKSRVHPLSNLEDSAKKEKQMSDIDPSKYFKGRNSVQYEIPIDKNAMKTETNKYRCEKISNVHDGQTPTQTCTTEIEAMNVGNDLEPGEIPDDTENSSQASDKEAQMFDDPKYSRSRNVYKEPRFLVNRTPRGYNTRYSWVRGGWFPPKRFYRKSHDYNWSDYTDEQQNIRTNNYNTLSGRGDLRNYLDSTENRQYKFAYEQSLEHKFPPIPYSAKYLYYRQRPPRRQYESARHRAIVQMRRQKSSVDTLSTQKWDNEKEHPLRGSSRRSDETDWIERYEEEHSTDRKDITRPNTTKFKNFKITRSFSDGDSDRSIERSRLKRSCSDIQETTRKKTSSETIAGNISHRLKLYRSHSDKSSDKDYHSHEKKISEEKHKRKSSKDRGKSYEKSIFRKNRPGKHSSTSSKNHISKEKADDEGKMVSKRKRSMSTERCMSLPREHDSNALQHENEEKISSVVTVVSSSDGSNSADGSIVSDEQRNDKRSKCIVKNKEAHLKCFEIIRDFAFKKAVRHSDSNWDKYSKRKFLFEDELIQQLERSFDRYLYSADDIKQNSGSGPLPRFVSDDLMITAMINTWKEPQIVASCDRQFREFDEIIGYVGYNIPCYWCEIIFADGKFVRAFPVLDPIGHRDDTMYCQTDN